MNIEQESLYKLLQGADIKSQYFFNTDFKTIAEKAEIYKRKNGKMPSINFLLEFSNKLSDKPEQVDSIEDLLYTQSKFKPELDDVNEVNELLLEFYKKERIKEFTLGLGKALKQSNTSMITRLSEQITEISKLSLSVEDFRENDIKKDLKTSSKKVELIPSGFPSTTHESLSMVGKGQVVSVVADTGFGKSISVINAVTQQYLNGYNTVYVSYEMPKASVLARMLSSISEVHISEINAGVYTTEEAELRLLAAEAVLEYDINFEKAFSRVLKGKDFSDCKIRTNYLKIIAIGSAGEEGISELPDSQGLLNILEEYKPDFLTVDLISEVKITKSAGSYETDLANLVRDFNSKALSTGAVVFVVSQPAGKSPYEMIFPKYCKAIRGSCSVNIIISATQEMFKDNIVVFIVEKCRHSARGNVIPMYKEFEYMRFRHIQEEQNLKMEDYFAEYAKSLKKLEGGK